MTILQTKTLEEAGDELKSQFLELTGYSRNDLLSWNIKTRRFMTRNGGMYELTEAGRIIHYSGPSPDPEDRL